MPQSRSIHKVLQGRTSMDGAGVRLQRFFGYHEASLFDPFLLLDYFGSEDPEQYRNGFPWHPHRGIETITYMLEGACEHGDSLGNKGVIATGDVQWMTAGSGIIHQEMPTGDEHGHMFGFQLWANLPRTQKMMVPRYREIKSVDIPRVVRSNGTVIRVISGDLDGVKGPVQDVVIAPEYLDIETPAQTEFNHPTPIGHTVFISLIKGRLRMEDTIVTEGSLVLFGDGERVHLHALDRPVRFLLISGQPLHEPIAWRGPIVMNTQEELDVAFREYHDGTFIKS